MDELVSTVNLLQDVFSASDCSGIDLPQIVVVGTQSSGKSSILEHIVGKSFLPRGTGIVTRCPLVLQMVASPSGNPAQNREYAIFTHDKTKVFTDYQLIRKEIEKQMNRLAGPCKGICQTSINLKFYSPSFLNLTLIDLPGLTKVPVDDQPIDIEEQTKALTLQYIKNPNSVIIAVIPANADMATSESLKLAREVDPEGTRTLAVVTKLDLMDEGTDAWDMLTGKIIPVKLGIIGVVNRSQKDIQGDKSIIESLKDEERFLYTKYRPIAEYHGCPYLTKKIQSLLVSHIRNCLPKLRERVIQKLATKRVELQQIEGSKLDKPTYLLELIIQFSNIYLSVIKGTSGNIQTKELQGGARIKYVFHECLSSALKSIEPLVGLTQADILTAMENASGVTSTIFVSEVAFELLVKRQIEQLRSPCLQCVDLVYNELRRIVQNCIEDPNLRLDRFPKLQREIEDVVNDLMQNRVPITVQSVDQFIDVQLAYTNTAHPEFLPNCVQGLNITMVGGARNDRSDKNVLIARKKSFTVVGLHNQEEPSLPYQGHHLQSVKPTLDKASQDYTLIQELIKSYFFIVRRIIQDTIPKIIMNLLVNFVVDHLQLELVSRLFKGNADYLLEESKVITDNKKSLKEEIGALEQAKTIISSLSPSE